MVTKPGHHKAADPDGTLRRRRVALFALMKSGAAVTPARIAKIAGPSCTWCGKSTNKPASPMPADPKFAALRRMLAKMPPRYRGYCSQTCLAYGQRDAAKVAASRVALDKRRCASCREPLPPGATLRRKFCGVACRVAAHRE